MKTCQFCKEKLKNEKQIKYCSLSCSAKGRIKEGTLGYQEGHKTRLGIKHTKEFCESRRGKGNPAWKGDNVTVGSLHDWVRVNFKKTGYCEFCKEEKKTEWSHKTHEYSRERDGWQELCRRCHVIYDMKNLGRKNR